MPYSEKNRGAWTEEEHNRYVQAINMYGTSWRLLEDYIQTRNIAQIRYYHNKQVTSKLKAAAVVAAMSKSPNQSKKRKDQEPAPESAKKVKSTEESETPVPSPSRVSVDSSDTSSPTQIKKRKSTADALEVTKKVKPTAESQPKNEDSLVAPLAGTTAPSQAPIPTISPSGASLPSPCQVSVDSSDTSKPSTISDINKVEKKDAPEQTEVLQGNRTMGKDDEPIDSDPQDKTEEAAKTLQGNTTMGKDDETVDSDQQDKTAEAAKTDTGYQFVLPSVLAREDVQCVVGGILGFVAVSVVKRYTA